MRSYDLGKAIELFLKWGKVDKLKLGKVSNTIFLTNHNSLFIYSSVRSECFLGFVPASSGVMVSVDSTGQN